MAINTIPQYPTDDQFSNLPNGWAQQFYTGQQPSPFLPPRQAAVLAPTATDYTDHGSNAATISNNNQSNGYPSAKDFLGSTGAGKGTLGTLLSMFL
jgi:hypothetical protein